MTFTTGRGHMEAGMIPLNQSYRREATLAAYPEIASTFARYEDWARSLDWRPHDHTHPSLSTSGRVHPGRVYDAALALHMAEYDGLEVCELGARASFLAPFLTQQASTVHATDLFGDRNPNLGDLAHWTELWTNAALRPDRIQCSQADMRDTDFEDESFDVVLCISAIEHVNEDSQAAREMARILRHGGTLIIGTDMSDEFRKVGGYYYDEAALFDRIIGPSGCDLIGDHDFSWEGSDRSMHKNGAFERTCCIFALRKP